MSGDPAISLLRREMRVRDGVVPESLEGMTLRTGENLLIGDTYLWRTELGLAFFYRRGEGIVVQREPWADARDEALCLKGSVYAAIASINGLYPIHASAVVHDGRVYAFTGPSGAGKSTLIAELGRRGLAMFCDDTLIVDLRTAGQVRCLPGHKRLKLWPDAIELTGAQAEETVGSTLEKRYASPAAGTVECELPLAELCFLEEGPGAFVESVSGGERLVRLQDDHYTTELFLAASRPDRALRFLQLAGLARSIRVSRFVRPRDRTRFGSDAGLAERLVRDGLAGQEI